MKEPLDQFADRILRNNELKEFITGLVKEKGVRLYQLSQIVKDMLKDGPVISECCDAVPMGGTSVDTSTAMYGERPKRQGRCAVCGQLATFHRNPNYVEKEEQEA